MKKIIISLFCLLVLCGCTKAPNDFENEDLSVSTGVYTVYNSLDCKITELYLYITGEDKGDNRVGSNGFNVGDNILLTYDGTEDTNLTLEYVAEDGDTGKFDTLHIEETPIWILAPDARTGATVISFTEPE